MEEELQTIQPDVEAVAETSADDVSSEFVSQLNQIAGREFKDVEDFTKHYKNLSSMVGKKDEAGEKLNAILAKAKPYADAYGADPVEFLETYLENPNVTEDDLKSTLSQVRELKKQEQSTVQNRETISKLERLEFQISNPELKDYMADIVEYAEVKKTTLEEAAKSSYIKKAVELSEKKSTTSIIQTNQKVANIDSDLARKRAAIGSGTTGALAEYMSAIGINRPE